MDGHEKLDKPRSIEDLSQRERVKRLQHQLGIIYDRVFLSGDWSADYDHPKETEEIRSNVFEDSVITDASILADELNSFVKNVSPTVQKNPDRATRTHLREFNRRLYLDVIEEIRTILASSAHKIRTEKEVEMEKCIDENIHSFRDIPLVYSKEIPTIRERNMPVDPVIGDDTAGEALHKILTKLKNLSELSN